MKQSGLILRQERKERAKEQREGGEEKTEGGVPVVVQQKQIRLGTMRWQVRSPASLSRLRIWYCHELWCGSQTWLGSCIAVAVV